MALSDMWGYYVRATAKVSKFPMVTLKAWTFLTTVFVFAETLHVVHPPSSSPAMLRHALLDGACMYCLNTTAERVAAKADNQQDVMSYAQCPN
eukprot:2635765-Rhodomonas_salina.1